VTERIWAPWRLEYVQKADEYEGCIFCDKPKEQEDEKNLLLCRRERAFVMLNAFPYNIGHLMVAPYSHTAELGGLADEEIAEMMALVRDGIGWLMSAYAPQGFNVGLNLGRAAGAGIESHIHLHVVPRWAGDTNFMPVIGDVRVMPEALAQSYKRLKEKIDE
jgi:ATP adenylyltransferase